MRSWLQPVDSKIGSLLWLLTGSANATRVSAFKVNRERSEPTGDTPNNPGVESGSNGTKEPGVRPEQRSTSWFHKSPTSIWTTNWLWETAIIALCFAAYSGQLPPDVNESHYLTKSKAFWDASYCQGDLFLGSSFSHWLFYALFGWLTKLMSLAAFAWTGRIVTWVLTAFAWQRLSNAVIPLRWMSVISALFFLLLNDRFHMAGEWVVGGFEAKGIAYFFVILGLGFTVRGNWKLVWPALGAAAAFHVLVGGWSVCACLIAWVCVHHKRSNQKAQSFGYWKMQFRSQQIPLLIGGLLSLFGVIPPLLADAGANPEVAALARSVYVNERISHHLLFGAFPVWNIARFSMIVVFWLLLNRWLKARQDISPFVFNRKLEPLRYFTCGALFLAFGGLVLSGLAERSGQGSFAESLLRFYWFRLADFAIPMSTALASCFVIAYWLEKANDFPRRLSSAIFCGCIMAAFGAMTAERHAVSMPMADLRSLPQYPEQPSKNIDAYRNWKKVCTWIRDSTPVDAVFITPNQQQTFKWYAHRHEVVAWKDTPQDPLSIVQWQQRLNDLFYTQQNDFGLLTYSDAELDTIAEKYDADYLVLLQRHFDLVEEKPKFKQVYPESEDAKSTYVVLKLGD